MSPPNANGPAGVTVPARPSQKQAPCSGAVTTGIVTQSATRNRDAAALLDAALRYAARGWPAFVLSASKAPLANCAPCRAEHLTPAAMEACRCLTCHGFYAATVGPDRLTEMIRRHPRGCLAVRTGAPSGLAAADVDPPGLPAMRAMTHAGQLPRTLAQRTGRGYHLLYAHPGTRIMSGANKIAPGIDSKADGGYIVVSPSIHPATRQRYTWLSDPDGPLAPLPAWLAGHLTPPAPPPPRPGWAPPATVSGAYAAAALDGEARAVAQCRTGRNDRLNAAAFSLGQLVAAGALQEDQVLTVLMSAAAECGLAAEDGPRQCEATIRSGLRAGTASPRAGAA